MSALWRALTADRSPERRRWAARRASPHPHFVLVASPHAGGICSSLHLSFSLPAVLGEWCLNASRPRKSIQSVPPSILFIPLLLSFLREEKKIFLACSSLVRDFKVIFHQLSLQPQEKKNLSLSFLLQATEAWNGKSHPQWRSNVSPYLLISWSAENFDSVDNTSQSVFDKKQE